MKRNCWEVKECGREVGGKNAARLGTCPAALEVRLDGVHSGRNAGRACWVVAGTLCAGEVQGTYANKFRACERCDFYQSVQVDEFPGFLLCSALVARMTEK